MLPCASAHHLLFSVLIVLLFQAFSGLFLSLSRVINLPLQCLASSSSGWFRALQLPLMWYLLIKPYFHTLKCSPKHKQEPGDEWQSEEEKKKKCQRSFSNSSVAFLSSPSLCVKKCVKKHETQELRTVSRGSWSKA